MSGQINQSSDPTIDPTAVAAIVREVLLRLSGPPSRLSLSDRVISASVVESLPGSPSEVHIPASSVVTPAASDEAASRGIRLVRGPGTLSADPVAVAGGRMSDEQVCDASDDARGESVRRQLARRGVTEIGAKVLLSDTPARDTYERVLRDGQRAVMVGSVDDVDRFETELRPTVWVLDMKRLNLIAAVNVVVRIARRRETA